MSFGRRLNLLFLSWSVWRVEPISVAQVGAVNPCHRGRSSALLFTCCERVASVRRYRVSSAVPVRSMRTFSVGSKRDFSFVCGRLGWPNTTKWKASPGDGKASMEAWARRLWRNSVWGPIPPTGGKNERKRSVLVDARGVPLSLVASGANVHDVKLLEATLGSIVYPRPKANICATESLCMDAGYVGYDAMVTTRNHGYQQNLKSRKQETEEKTRTPGHKARRWVVERTHSWFNRFRKLLVSFEKTEESFIALLSLAAAMICWRQTVAIYG